MAPPVILFDYPFSPYAKKIRILFAAAGISYKRCDVPMVLPRPTLLDLDITYRRIPVLAIGGDVYCDSALIIDIIQKQLGGLPTSPADHAYEFFGNHVFYQGLSCIPPSFLTEDFVKDRTPIFPICARKDFGTLGPSGKSEFKTHMAIIERDFLRDANPFIGGEKPALADIHLIWVVSWMMSSLGLAEVPGCGKDKLPKIWKLIESLPAESEDMISAEEAKKIILESPPKDMATSIAEDDVLEIQVGTKISIESTDSAPGTNPQYGTLLRTDEDSVTVALGNGIHLHFPRRGYIFRPE